MSVLQDNPKVLSGILSVRHCFLAYETQKIPESRSKALILKRFNFQKYFKQQNKTKLCSLSDLPLLLFCSLKILNEITDNCSEQKIMVWVLVIWNSKRIVLFLK